jgi:peptidoglycan hydrolase CwlO-like protein
MGSEASEQMMALLSELSTLKELNRQFEASPNENEEDAQRLRHERGEEITQEIKALAQKKAEQTDASSRR